MCVRHDFDSDGGFKGKVGAEDDVVGKVQNDELSRVLECFNFRSEIEDLTVLGCLGRAKMSRNLGIYNVWATSQKSTSSIILGSQIWVQNVVDKGAAFCSTSSGFLKIPVRWDVHIWPFCWFFIGFTDILWKLILGMLGPLGRRHVSVHICFKLLWFFEHFDVCDTRIWSWRGF